MERDLIQDSPANSGFTDVQSKTLSHILAQLATKEDLNVLRAELRSELNTVRAELRSDRKSLRAELRSDQQSIRAQLTATIEQTAREMQAQLMKTMVGLVISLASIFTLLDIFID